MFRNAGLAALLLILVPPSAAGADDRHAGYYYPEPATVETYEARAKPLGDSTRERRLGFVTAITGQMARNPYPPTYAIFAKGDDAEKLIIVATQTGFYDTIYRARALFASMTALSRQTLLFQELKVESSFTFFDLCRMLGFVQITISDGEDFAHQVLLK